MRNLLHNMNYDRAFALFSGQINGTLDDSRRPQNPVNSSLLIEFTKSTNNSNSESAADCHRRRLEPGVIFASLVAGYMRPRNKGT